MVLFSFLPLFVRVPIIVPLFVHFSGLCLLVLDSPAMLPFFGVIVFIQITVLGERMEGATATVMAATDGMSALKATTKTLQKTLEFAQESSKTEMAALKQHVRTLQTMKNKERLRGGKVLQ